MNGENKKVVLVILDGIGVNNNSFGNAVKNAETPRIDQLIREFPSTTLQASGKYVGLPSDQMGNSEVGHLNIGAGRIVYTGLSLINKEIEDRKFYENKAFLEAIKQAKERNSKIHICGLVSNGGVHSTMSHINALIELVSKNKLTPIVHAFADGRDVDPKSFIKDGIQLEETLKKYQGKLATVAGRYYAMDRDKRWERVQLAFDALIGNSETLKFNDLESYIEESYKNNVTDEFLLPAINEKYNLEEIAIRPNDVVIFANFRPDRARQMSHVLFGSDYYDYKPKNFCENIFLVTMTNYEGITPSMVAYPPLEITNTFGHVLAANEKKQLRIAETEKYAHVTFFFDGGKEIDFPKEKKILIPSPKVATYDLKPSMSALEITENLLKVMNDYDVIIVNYANGDMVGHTGNYQAAIKAVECLDEQIGLLYKNSLKTNSTLFITADHGNADEMITADNKPITKHTMNPVPFIVTDANVTLKEGGSLANIVPSILKYMGLNIPEEMTAEPIIELKK